MKTPNNEMPSLWWLSPWTYAIQLKSAVDLLHDMADDSAKQIHDLQTGILVKEGEVEYQKKIANDFKRKVELKLSACKHSPSFGDTLDLVDWVAGEHDRMLSRIESLASTIKSWSELEKENSRVRNQLKEELHDVKSNYASLMLRINKAEAELTAERAKIAAMYTQQQVDDLCDNAILDHEWVKANKKKRKPAMARSSKKKGRK